MVLKTALVSPWFWTPSAWCCYTAFGVSLVLDTQCMVLLYGLWCLLGSGHPVHGAAIRPLVSPWFWTPSAWWCDTAFGVSLVLDTQCMVLLYGLWCLLGHPVHCVAIGSLVCYIIWPLVSPWFWTPCAWCCYRAFCVLYGLWCLLGSGHPVDSAAVGRFRQGC